MALYLIHQNIHSLLAHHVSALLHRGQHRFAGDGTFTISESANADILRYAKAHAFHRIENTDSRIIIHGKERIREIFTLHHSRRKFLSISTTVTDIAQGIIHLQAVPQDGIPIAVVTVFRNLQLHGGTVESNALATSLNQIADRLESSHIVVHHHTVGVYASTNPVVKD